MPKRLKDELQQTGELDPRAPLSRKAAAEYLRRRYLVGSASFLAKMAMRGEGTYPSAVWKPDYLPCGRDRRLGKYASRRSAGRIETSRAEVG
jgi:hypothetical protein